MQIFRRINYHIYRRIRIQENTSEKRDNDTSPVLGWSQLPIICTSTMPKKNEVLLHLNVFLSNETFSKLSESRFFKFQFLDKRFRPVI